MVTSFVVRWHYFAELRRLFYMHAFNSLTAALFFFLSKALKKYHLTTNQALEPLGWVVCPVVRCHRLPILPPLSLQRDGATKGR
jgi:hypothetical protein